MFVFQTGAEKNVVAHTSSAETQRSIFSDNISFSFFKTMMQSDKNNVGFSPYSAASALALLYAGADDKTKTSIKNKLGLTSNDEDILKMLNKSEVAGFSSVNLIASQSGFKPSYETSIKAHGGGTCLAHLGAPT